MAYTARKEKNPLQIDRKDGKNCFVESLKNSFEIGKVLFKFVTYDQNQEAGSKFTNEVDIYMDFEHYLRVSQSITSGQIDALFAQKKQEGKFASETLAQGGTTAAALAMKGQKRPDGLGISRMMTIAPSNIGYFFTALSGPGDNDDDGKGLIVPKYSFKNPEQKVSIPISKNDINELFLKTDAELKAYITAQATHEKMIKLEAEVTMLKDIVLLMAEKSGIEQNKLQAIQKTYEETINPVPYYQKSNQSSSQRRNNSNYHQNNNSQRQNTGYQQNNNQYQQRQNNQQQGYQNAGQQQNRPQQQEYQNSGQQQNYSQQQEYQNSGQQQNYSQQQEYQNSGQQQNYSQQQGYQKPVPQQNSQQQGYQNAGQQQNRSQQQGYQNAGQQNYSPQQNYQKPAQQQNYSQQQGYQNPGQQQNYSQQKQQTQQQGYQQQFNTQSMPNTGIGGYTQPIDENQLF